MNADRAEKNTKLLAQDHWARSFDVVGTSRVHPRLFLPRNSAPPLLAEQPERSYRT